jgi:hypothetical protein
VGVALRSVPRNAPCPCGSGKKHKLCCGTTRDEERALARAAEAVAAAAELPTLFPLVRPDCKKFDAWAEPVLRRGLDESTPPTVVREGIDALTRGERHRIARWLPDSMPFAWEKLSRDLDEESLCVAVLAGAVTAGLSERLGVDCDLVELLDEGGSTDPVDALALVVDPCDLWNPLELQRADAALSSLDDELDDEAWEAARAAVLAAEVERLASKHHRSRLVRLVGYVEAQLPWPEFPHASNVVADACERFRRDRAVRPQLAVCLLGDLL